MTPAQTLAVFNRARENRFLAERIAKRGLANETYTRTHLKDVCVADPVRPKPRVTRNQPFFDPRTETWQERPKPRPRARFPSAHSFSPSHAPEGVWHCVYDRVTGQLLFRVFGNALHALSQADRYCQAQGLGQFASTELIVKQEATS